MNSLQHRNIVIRPTVESDIAALQAVEISASKAFLIIDGLGSFGGDSCATEDQHHPTIKAKTSWVAETEDGKAVGFLAALPEGGALHIYEIDVHLDYQKQGIGRALMAHAENEARMLGLSELTLTTFSHVPWNAPFYETLGFRIVTAEEQGERLAKILKEEGSLGLPSPEKRCAMRKTLAEH